MLFGKYLNKYYLKYLLFILLGVATLVVVDIAQVEIGDVIEKVVNSFRAAEEVGFTDEIQAVVLETVKKTLFIAAIMFLGRIFWRLCIFNASHHIENNLRHEMFLKAERLSVNYYHQNKVGAVMAWFTNDLESVEEFVGWGTVMLVDATFLSIYEIIIMFKAKWQLAIIILIPIILIVIWGALVERFMSMKWENRQKAYDELYDFSQESFTGIRVIKAFVKETQELHAFAKIAKKNKDVNVNFVKIAVIFDVVIELIIGAIVAFILGIGAYFIYKTNAGEPVAIFGPGTEITLDVGELSKFLVYFDILIWPMIALGQVVTMYSKAHASLKRITHFLDTPEEVKDEDGAVDLTDYQGSITFKDFSFIYPDSKTQKPYLKNVSLEIKAGESIGVVGRIGSGKTTLINSLLRIYNVDRGQIYLDGHDIMDIKINSLRNNIAYSPQDNFIFSDTIDHNIAFSDTSLDDSEIVKAAKFAVIHEDIESFKDRYDTVSGERGVTLSGGQKQRISIARAFIKDSKVLILDDSVSAVDVKTEEEILANIKKYRQNKTTIIVASRVSTVSKLDRILVMSDGCVEAFDTHENLLKISPTYQKMVYLQQLEKELEN